MRRDERATAVYEATQRMELVREDGQGNRIELQRPPELFHNPKTGELVGVHAWVKMFRGNEELRVDPHRIFVNPPMEVVDKPPIVDTERGLVTPRVTRRSPENAFWNVLWRGVKKTPNPRGWRTRGTVTTVFASLGGYIDSRSATYLTARSGGSLNVFQDGFLGTSYVGQTNNVAGSGQFGCFEAFFQFDTSSIRDADQVTAITLNAYLDVDSSGTDFTCEARTFDWGASLASGDWVAGASLSGNTLLATIGTSGIAGSSFNTFTSQAAFLTATNLKTGIVYMILDSSRHVAGNTPTGDEFIGWGDPSFSGTDFDPYLDITHQGVTMPYASKPARIWRAR